MAKIHEKLLKIQNDLKVPKSHYNEFGHFHYRSLEDIIEAAKPLMAEQNTVLLLSDEIFQVENRFYVKATATLVDTEDGESVSAYGLAREAEKKTKMDDAQVTGAASSYARKYALCGLFAIDGQDDADATTPEDEKPQTTNRTSNKTNQTASEAKDNAIKVILGRQSNFIRSGALGFRTAQFEDKKIGWIMTVNPELTEKLANLKAGITQQVIGEVVPNNQKTDDFPKDTLKDRVFMVSEIA